MAPLDDEPIGADVSTCLTGRAAAPGIALAPALVVAERTARPAGGVGRPAPPEEELARVTAALAATRRSLEELSTSVGADVGAEEAEIFAAHAEFAADPELADRAAAAVAGGATAEEAVRTSFDGFRALLAASGNEYLAARATDLDDVRDQVLDQLAGGGGAAAVPTSRVVVVARELTPSQTARLPREHLAALVCAEGSPTSHAAILARALGIPSVMGAAGILDVATGVLLAVDGRTGEVLVDPDEDQRADFERRGTAAGERQQRLAKLRDRPGATADGRRVELAANVNDPDALEAARTAGAEGAGLVRTELLFMAGAGAEGGSDGARPPTVAEQEAYYRRVLAAFDGRRVVIRTMDVGADKPVPWLDRHEENPALGLRGLRLALARPELLTDQLRALLRASTAGRLAIMFPMVSTAAELTTALDELDRLVAELGVPRPEVGAMVEVPVAALAARTLVARLDFLSVGTNDLLQYLFAADRLNADVAHLPDVFDPVVLALLGDVAAAAHDNGAWIGVCGEAAADPVAAAALVGLGVDELSMTPTAIPEVKDVLARLDSGDLVEAARLAVAAPDAATARRLFDELVARAAES